MASDSAAVRILTAALGLLTSVVSVSVALTAAPVAAEAASPLRLADDGRTPVEVRQVFDTEWSTPEPAHRFDGDPEACDAGSVDPAYLRRQVERINTVRTLAGLGGVALDASPDAIERQQAAALIVAANPGEPSHTPAADAACVSTLGRAASQTSNLFQVRGVEAIDGYLVDAGNPAYGHRRWLLTSRLEQVAIGEVVGDHYSSSGHALDVVTGLGAGDGSLAIAWPPVGAVPRELVPSTSWTLQTDRAAFGPATTVAVRVDGRLVATGAATVGAGNPDHFLAFDVPGVDASSPSGTIVDITVSGLTAAAGRSELSWTTVLVGADAASVRMPATRAETVFQHLVGRTPTAAERAALRRDARTTLTALVGTPDHVAAEVDRLYRSMLGRGPDAGGHAFWVEEIRSGRRSLRDVVVAFFASEEFVARQSSGGAGDGGWVDAIYDRVLDRRPDAGGRAFWVQELASGSRSHERIVGDFYDSPEATADRVDALVRVVLDRPSTRTERATWTDPDQRGLLVALLASVG